MPIKFTRYIDLTLDFAFKYLLGSEKNGDLLCDFLNSILGSDMRIVSATVMNSERPKANKQTRGIILDILCKDESGSQFIIEVQRKFQEHFVDRSIFYTADIIRDQATLGDWDYNLIPVYTICLLGFNLHLTPTDRYRHHIVLCHKDSGLPFSNKINLIYIELPKIKGLKKIPEDRGAKWCYILANIESYISIPEAFRNDPIFRKVFEIAEILNQKKETMLALRNTRWSAHWDLHSEINSHKKLLEKATEQGLETGIKQGLEKGIEKGKAINRAELLEKIEKIAPQLEEKGVLQDVMRIFADFGQPGKASEGTSGSLP